MSKPKKEEESTAGAGAGPRMADAVLSVSSSAVISPAAAAADKKLPDEKKETRGNFVTRRVRKLRNWLGKLSPKNLWRKLTRRGKKKDEKEMAAIKCKEEGCSAGSTTRYLRLSDEVFQGKKLGLTINDSAM